MNSEIDIKENVKDSSTWLRGLFILLFTVLLGLAKFITGMIVLFQFGHTLITRQTNPQLLAWGASLAAYIQSVLLYLTYNTDDKPFPFADWPDADSAETPAAARADAPAAASGTARRKSAARKKSPGKNASEENDTAQPRETSTGN